MLFMDSIVGMLAAILRGLGQLCFLFLGAIDEYERMNHI